MQDLPLGHGIVSVHCGLASSSVLQIPSLQETKRLSMSWQSWSVLHG
jgi:hypothetical protein